MNNEETTSISTYVSLCSGYDGIGIGLKRAIPNLRTIAHVEIETYAIANLIAKMEAGQLDACPVFTDLKQFPYRELRDRVTILSAGFPCQPFSSAGKRQATEDPRHLYPWIADGITAMRPRYVLLENVEGIISAKTGDGESVLKYVLGDLEGRGYSCTWGVFSASEVGAPHQRKRVFILAKPSSTGLERTTRESVQRRSEGLTSTKGEKLGNTSSVGSCGGSTDENGQQSEVSRSGLESTEVGNAKHDGSSTTTHRKGLNQTSYRSEERKDNTIESSGTSRREVVRGLYKTQYPARPGEEQYDWEEPRTVGNTSVERCEQDSALRDKQQASRSDQVSGNSGSSTNRGQTKSCVGGTANGTSYRVDRLRLLGNGVVPDTCELAFKTLIKQL